MGIERRRDEFGLTPRQRQVMQLLNFPNVEIAKRVHVSYRAVEEVVAQMISELGVTNRTEVMLVGLAKGAIVNPFAPFSPEMQEKFNTIVSKNVIR